MQAKRLVRNRRFRTKTLSSVIFSFEIRFANFKELHGEGSLVSRGFMRLTVHKNRDLISLTKLFFIDFQKKIDEIVKNRRFCHVCHKGLLLADPCSIRVFCFFAARKTDMGA